MFGVIVVPEQVWHLDNGVYVYSIPRETMSMLKIAIVQEAGINEMNSIGEVHNSAAPIMLALAITLSLGGLLFWPLAVIGLPILAFSIFSWLREETRLWPHRRNRARNGEWGDASWAMFWIIITECIIFASFFAYWFWARWHTVSWDGAVGGSWPADGVDLNLELTALNTLILLFSGILVEKSEKKHANGDPNGSIKILIGAISMGVIFLIIQLYEYSTSGFLWSDHPYGTAFYSLTGLHGLHVIVGLVALAVIMVLVKGGILGVERHDGFRAVAMYWHFVDFVWFLLFLVVYLEVI